MMVSLLLHVGCALGAAFAPNFAAYATIRFVLGGANFGVFLAAYVLGKWNILYIDN